MSAILSPDMKYRYRLERELDVTSFPLAMSVFMVNPSTADADNDDATIRRLIGFSKRYGVNHLMVGNLFALRATDVRELGRVPDPVGPDNDDHIRNILVESRLGRAVVGWGSSAKIPPQHRGRIAEFAGLARSLGVDLWCWGTTADGSPKHPLYLPNDAVLTHWKYNG